MGVISTIKNAVSRWRTTDPYHYECTVCERTFSAEQSTCPECGGDVERVSGEFDESTVDPTP